MRRIFLIIVVIVYSSTMTGQEVNKQKEIGFSFANLDKFGFSYKFGDSNSMWRVKTLLISSSTYNESSSTPEGLTSDNSKRENNYTGVTLKFGKEYLKSVNEKLEFRYGADLSFGYSKSEYNLNHKSDSYIDNSSKLIDYSYGIDFVIGFNYFISENILLGAEILPGLSYTEGNRNTYSSDNKKIEVNTYRFNYGFSNQSALLTLAYRF
ncbi:MAG: hypothetical protein HRT66_10535 [Flavobacteriaceae bacterium]|nr:hypothetical protein [Flavobacteriaceae bacterium]